MCSTMMMKLVHVPMALVVMAAVLAVATPVAAQDSTAGGARISGNASLGVDLYDLSSTPPGSVPPRRPPNLVRLQVNLNASYSDLISLPFSLTLTSRETNVTTPRLDAPSIGQMLLNPLNALSFSPKIGWAQFYLGTHTQTFSELSGGDAQIVGAGVDLRPGQFRVAASVGLTQRAVEADTVHNTLGAFSRIFYGLKLAYGREDTDEVHLGVNLIRSEDNPESINRLVSSVVVVPDTATPSITDTITARHPLMPIPVAGVLGSLDLRVPLAEGVALKGEFAVSGYTRDQQSPAATAEVPVAGSFIDLKTSTRADYAATVQVAANRETWGVNAKALYIRPGFVTLGYPLLAPDRLELTVSPRVTLFDGDLLVNGTFGHRTNNLGSTALATTTQILASASVQTQLTEALSLGASYTNFGLRNTENNDTLKIESVAQSASITPSVSFNALGAGHMIMLMLALDTYTDLNTVNGALNNNDTRSILLTYALSFEDVPVTVDVTGGTLNNHLAVGDLVINSGSVGCSVRLAEGTVTPSVNVGISENTLEGYTADVLLTGRVGLSWRINDRLAFGSSYSLADMAFGSSRPGAAYTESYGNASLTLNF